VPAGGSCQLCLPAAPAGALVNYAFRGLLSVVPAGDPCRGLLSVMPAPATPKKFVWLFSNGYADITQKLHTNITTKMLPDVEKLTNLICFLKTYRYFIFSEGFVTIL
jgi:hypothetical protein